MKYILIINPDQFSSVLSQVQSIGVTPQSTAFGMIVTPDIPVNIASQLSAIPGVKSVSPDKTVTIQGTGNVVASFTKLNNFYSLARNPLTLPQAISYARSTDSGVTRTPTSISRNLVGADYAEGIGITGKGIKIAVIDTGLAPTPEGYNQFQLLGSTVPAEPQPFDEVGHGSHVATNIAGQNYTTGQGVLLEGVARDSTVGVVKCLGYVIGAGTDSTILDAMKKAQEWGADILSASLGSSYTTDDPSAIPQCIAAEQLINSGMIVVFANGNDGPNGSTVGVPACDPVIISVGAIDPTTGMIADFSSRGPTAQGVIKPDLVAPGVSITSCTTGWMGAMQLASGDYPGTGSLSGTSQATPHAAACIALALQYARQLGKNLQNQDILNAMSKYGDFTGNLKNNSYGYGLITFQRLKAYIDNDLGYVNTSS